MSVLLVDSGVAAEELGVQGLHGKKDTFARTPEPAVVIRFVDSSLRKEMRVKEEGVEKVAPKGRMLIRWADDEASSVCARETLETLMVR
jgi:hypothetical protein